MGPRSGAGEGVRRGGCVWFGGEVGPCGLWEGGFLVGGLWVWWGCGLAESRFMHSSTENMVL